MVRPGQRNPTLRTAGAQAPPHGLGHLRPEAQLVDHVAERVRHGRVKVVVQVVHVHIGAAEAAAGGDVEVAYHLIDAQVALDAAALLALRVQPLAVVLALALLHAPAPSEGPRHRGVRFAHFVARVAAAGFGGRARWGGAVAFAAVGGIEVGCFVFFGVTM